MASAVGFSQAQLRSCLLGRRKWIHSEHTLARSAVAEQVVHMSDSSARFPYHNRSGRMTDRGVPTDTIMVGADNTYGGRNDYIRATTSGGSLSATLVFPRSFNRGATSGLRQSPRFESPARKPYTSARHDVDPYVRSSPARQPRTPRWPNADSVSIRSIRPCIEATARADHLSIGLHQGVRDANLWIKRPTRFTAKGAGVPHLPFGPTKLQRSP